MTLTAASFFKLPAVQTEQENCVAHNGSLIPVPGRDIFVQAWYQGGISIIDFTDAAHPKEIGYFDRGPLAADKLYNGGQWSSYWYNGHVFGSEIARGLDILELTPTANLSQNEIDAAKLVQLDHFNAQLQPKLVWPADFAVARAYVDQLARGQGIARNRAARIMRDLRGAEKLEGARRQAALVRLVKALVLHAKAATDTMRMKALTAVVNELAGQSR